jgi:ribosomal-protein-alanine N-acetyltransferase
MHFIGVRNREETTVALAAMVDHWNEHGFGIWAMFARDDGRFVGRCGLRRQPDLVDVELAYTLHKEYWNRGLATEASKTGVAWGFAALGLERIISFALPANRGSTRVMEKIGMRFEKRAPWKELDHAWYAVTRAEFAAPE